MLFRSPKMETDVKKSILKYINQVILLYTELLKDNFSEKGLAIKTLDLVKKEYHID